MGYPYSCLGNGTRRLSSRAFELAASRIVGVPDEEDVQRHVGTNPA